MRLALEGVESVQNGAAVSAVTGLLWSAVKIAVKTMLGADKIRRLQGTVADQIGSVRTCSPADTPHTGLLLVRILQTLPSYWPASCVPTLGKLS